MFISRGRCGRVSQNGHGVGPSCRRRSYRGNNGRSAQTLPGLGGGSDGVGSSTGSRGSQAGRRARKTRFPCGQSGRGISKGGSRGSSGRSARYSCPPRGHSVRLGPKGGSRSSGGKSARKLRGLRGRSGRNTPIPSMLVPNTRRVFLRGKKVRGCPLLRHSCCHLLALPDLFLLVPDVQEPAPSLYAAFPRSATDAQGDFAFRRVS